MTMEELSLGRNISMDHVLEPGIPGILVGWEIPVKLGHDHGLKTGNVLTPWGGTSFQAWNNEVGMMRNLGHP